MVRARIRVRVRVGVRVRARGRLSLGGAPAGRKEDDMPHAPPGVRAGAGVEIAIGVVRDARRAWH